MLLLAFITACVGVTLTGEPDAIRALRAASDALADAEGDPCVAAVVSTDTRGLKLHLSDREGREADHLVGNADIAASVIESWLDEDLAGALLAERTPPAQETAARPVERVVIRDERDFALGVAGELRGGDDGSRWAGVRVWGCFEVGPLCVGVNGRVLGDPGDEGDSERLRARRLTAALLLRGEWPFSIGPVRLAPGLGIGLGFVSAERKQDHEEGGGDGDIRTEASLTATFPLTQDFGLDWELGVSVPLGARHGDIRTDDGPLPSSPRFYAGTSVGVRWNGL